MKKKSVIKNYLYNLTYQLLVMVVPLITTPYLSRVLGAEGVGIYSFTISIVTYFTLFGSLGIAMYAQREIAYVQNDKEKRSRIFFEVFMLRGTTLIISMVIFYYIFAAKGEYSIYYKILLLDILATIFDVSAFFQGMEEFKKIIIRNLIVKVISIVCIFTIVKTENDLWKYLLIYSTSNLIGNISLWFYLPKYISKVKIKSLNVIKHLKPTVMLFIPQIAIQIYTVLDKTMIGVMIVGKTEVGYYEQAQKIVKLLLTIVTSLGTVMLPRIANQFMNGEENVIKNSIKKSFKVTYLFAIPVALGLIAVAKDLIPLFLGEEYMKSIDIIYVISPIILFIGVSNVIGMQYLLPTKRQKEYTISVISGAIINLILNLILISKLKSIGAAFGTVIAELSVAVIQFFYIRKDFKLRQLILASSKYLISGIAMFFIILIGNRFLLYRLSSAVIRIGIDTALGIMTYGVGLIILNDELVQGIIKKCIKKDRKQEENLYE